MGSEQDFIAEDDIFISAEGKVVEKKLAQTKLASKGARVAPADVEKYGLRATDRGTVQSDEVILTKSLNQTQTRQKKARVADISPKEDTE